MEKYAGLYLGTSTFLIHGRKSGSRRGVNFHDKDEISCTALQVQKVQSIIRWMRATGGASDRDPTHMLGASMELHQVPPACVFPVPL